MYAAKGFVILSFWIPAKCPCTGTWLDKLRFLHIVRYYSAVQKNEEELYELIRNVSRL